MPTKVCAARKKNRIEDMVKKKIQNEMYLTKLHIAQHANIIQETTRMRDILNISS